MLLSLVYVGGEDGTNLISWLIGAGAELGWLFCAECSGVVAVAGL